MANAIDFRADQIQVNKLIVSGSNVNSSNCLLIYGVGAQGSPANHGVINSTTFPSGAVGSDTFFYVSGAIGSKGTTQSGVAVFGGDMHISGNLTVGGVSPAGRQFFTEIGLKAIQTTGSVALTYLSASTGAQITGSVVQGDVGNLVSGTASHAEGGGTNAAGDYSHAEGEATEANGNFSHAEGSNTHANGASSHAEGGSTIAQGDASHAEGSSTTATGIASHAEGQITNALGNYSHAEGYGTTATGVNSHAEGNTTNALADYSHTEGFGTQTFEPGSHAEGYYSIAGAQYSHAEGYYTIASGSYQTVVGRYNEDNNDFSLFVVGNGYRDMTPPLFPVVRQDILRVNTNAVEVTGSLIVGGSGVGITGSIQYVDINNTTPFIVGSGVTTNYNSLGQWEITGSSGQNILYASDATAENGTGGGSASTSGTGAASTFTLASPGSLTFTYTSTAMQSPRVVWTLPDNARKVTMYAKVAASSGFNTSGFRYIMAGMRYAGETLPTNALFGMSVNDNDTVYSGDKRTGSNAGVSVGTVGLGVFQLKVTQSWFRVIWDLEAGTCSYSFGTGSGGAKPVYWKLLTTSRITGDNNSTGWPIGSNAQIVVFFDSYDNNAATASIQFYPELLIN